MTTKKVPTKKAKPATKKKTTTKKEKRVPPLSRKWVNMAIEQGLQASCVASDELIDDIVSWSQKDVRKVLAFMLGMLRGTAMQLGRLSSIMVHLGKVPAQVIQEMAMVPGQEAFSAVHDYTKKVETVDFDVLFEVLTATMSSKKREETPNKDLKNVIKLPVRSK
jgi:hypothetical protein